MGVALGAVADDRDGLAVEQGEVSVVVVEHRTRQATCQPRGAYARRRLPAPELLPSAITLLTYCCVSENRPCCWTEDSPW